MLDIEALSKTYNGTPAVIEASLQIGLGALICLLGPSGCGNSILLRVIAGLTGADAGSIRIDRTEDLPADSTGMADLPGSAGFVTAALRDATGRLQAVPNSNLIADAGSTVTKMHM